MAMIPDEIRDEKFAEEIAAATKIVEIDVRPSFNEETASDDYCRRNGIPTSQKYQQVDYFQLYHAVFNLLMRNNMLLKKQPKEIMTGFPALGEEENVSQENK